MPYRAGIVPRQSFPVEEPANINSSKITILSLTPSVGMSIMRAPEKGLLEHNECFAQEYRGIAQSGSAPALGAGCREFESLYPDQFSIQPEVLGPGNIGCPCFSALSVVAVAHLVEHRIVTPEVAGSRPVGHPI